MSHFEPTASGYCQGCSVVALLWMRRGQWLCYDCINHTPYPRYQAWFSWKEPRAKPIARSVVIPVHEEPPKAPRGNYVIRPGRRGATFEALYDNGDVVLSYQQDEAEFRRALDDDSARARHPRWMTP